MKFVKSFLLLLLSSIYFSVLQPLQASSQVITQEDIDTKAVFAANVKVLHTISLWVSPDGEITSDEKMQKAIAQYEAILSKEIIANSKELTKQDLAQNEKVYAAREAFEKSKAGHLMITSFCRKIVTLKINKPLKGQIEEDIVTVSWMYRNASPCPHVSDPCTPGTELVLLIDEKINPLSIINSNQFLLSKLSAEGM
ncbi:MAG: hypothetical protein ACSHX6_15015 [Akkermansiaceae bacterium]